MPDVAGVDGGVGELVVDDLPEELAVGLVEAHHHALVARDVRVARLVVVGADEDAAAGHDGAAVGRAAELGLPLDVLLLLLFDAPRIRHVLFERVGDVALDGPAEHGAVVRCGGCGAAARRQGAGRDRTARRRPRRPRPEPAGSDEPKDSLGGLGLQVPPRTGSGQCHDRKDGPSVASEAARSRARLDEARHASASRSSPATRRRSARITASLDGPQLARGHRS